MLSLKAQKLIDNYLSLPFPGVEGARCPYFNNAKLHARGQLRVLIGKGTPQEIVEEAKIISIQYRAGLFDHDGHCCLHGEHGEKPSIASPESGAAVTEAGADELRKFLIDHNLGVDCSGFATHILRAHFLETKGVDITKKFIKNISAPWWRKIIMRLRPMESLGVRSGYANDKNTEKLKNDYAKLQPGDVVVMLETGPAFVPTGLRRGEARKRNHILIITDCDGQKIKYVHARAWSSEGQYGHGETPGK